MKLLMQKNLGALRPVDEAGEQALQKIKNGAVLMIEAKQPRNGSHHKLYFALVNIVFQNQEIYETPEQLHNALKIAAGIYEPLTMPNGTVHKIPGSIAFNRMDQVAFSAFYDKVCDLIAEHFIPGISSEDLKREVESMIGAST